MYLGRSFFTADPVTVARALVGAVLEVSAPGSRRAAGRIVEVEAYGGPGDAASHAAAGPTPRSSIMFGPPGVAYVYFIYGMHHCLNVVTGPAGIAGAVLIRALEPLEDREGMAQRRGLDPRRCRDRDLTGGPGRLCRALGIDLAWNGLAVTAGALSASGAPGRLRLAGWDVPPSRVIASRRIGVQRAAEVPWRFCDPDSACLSRPPE